MHSFKSEIHFEKLIRYSLGAWVILYAPGQANPGAKPQCPSLHRSGMLRIRIGNYWTIVVVVIVDVDVVDDIVVVVVVLIL